MIKKHDYVNLIFNKSLVLYTATESNKNDHVGTINNLGKVSFKYYRKTLKKKKNVLFDRLK